MIMTACVCACAYCYTVPYLCMSHACTLCACIYVDVDMSSLYGNHDLILAFISYPMTDIPRVDSFGYKTRQKDEVQNCVLLASAAHALQKDVQG